MSRELYNNIRNTYITALASGKPEAVYLAIVYDKVHEAVKRIPTTSSDFTISIIKVLHKLERENNGILASAISEDDEVFATFARANIRIIDHLR